MNMAITGRVVLLALMLAVTACSFDTALGARSRINPVMEKATVDPLPPATVNIESDKPKVVEKTSP
jgi:hypothetical protein